MYQIRSINNKGQVFYGFVCDTLWAANIIAYACLREYPELEKAEIVNRRTGLVEKTYVR